MANGKALALPEELSPLHDSLGNPIGKLSTDISRVIRPPVGVGERSWQKAIAAAAELFRLSGGTEPPTQKNMVEISDGMDYAHKVTLNVWGKIFDGGPNQEKFATALVLRGVLKTGKNLSGEQLMALNVLSDITSGKTLEQRLKQLGVPWYKYQSWLEDKNFAEQLKHRAEKVMDAATGPAMVALSERAQYNNDSLKYMLQLTGRYDPNRQGQADVRAFLNGVVETLQRNIDDPDLLMKIAGELAVLSSTHLGA